MKVHKTIKLFIDGEFVRSESGRTFLLASGSEEQRLAQASPKDFRNAVTAAKQGHMDWRRQSAYLRGQILYRMAEMCEGHRGSFAESDHVDDAIDRLVYYAGFSDKYQQLAGSVNPVNGPFHHFTSPESRGVTVLVAEDEALPVIVDAMAAILVSGNSLVMVLGKSSRAFVSALSEIVATADLPSGVVNILSADVEALDEVIAGHLEVRGLCYLGTTGMDREKIGELAAGNLKRLCYQPAAKSLESILEFVELKSVWHPRGF